MDEVIEPAPEETTQEAAPEVTPEAEGVSA
jgi:hypothetical protein